MAQSLEDHLAAFTNQLDRLPEASEPPSTTLQILGRSRRERAWQALLFYFLSPDAPHGLDNALLAHFLTALSARGDLTYEYSRFELGDVQVATEVVASNNRRPDGVIWVDEEWFLCFELKVGAAEGADQTRDYVDVRSFSGIDVNKHRVPEEGHHYLYLAPEEAPAPEADAFVHVSWEWVASELRSFLTRSHGGYPARTTAQLRDFIGTIRDELTMTEYQESQEEKAALYVEHYDAIQAAQDAFETRWDELATDWGSRLAEASELIQIQDVSELDMNVLAIDVADESGDSARWYLKQGESDWAGLIKEGWWRRKDDHSIVYPLEESDEIVRISLYQRLRENRELAIEETTLELQWWHGTGNPREFQHEFKETLYATLEAEDRTPPSSVEMTGRRGNFLNARYDIPVDQHSDFFDAYIAALRTAFVDLAVENRGLIELIDEAFEDTLGVSD